MKNRGPKSIKSEMNRSNKEHHKNTKDHKRLLWKITHH